jgi:hypothetical protein
MARQDLIPAGNPVRVRRRAGAFQGKAPLGDSLHIRGVKAFDEGFRGHDRVAREAAPLDT